MVRLRHKNAWFAVALLALIATIGTARLRQRRVTYRTTVQVRLANLTSKLTETGTLRAAESTTFRSPFEGREMEIAFITPEGTRVQPGDLLVRLESRPLEVEKEHAVSLLRQARLDLGMADLQLRDARSALELAAGAEGSLEREEAEESVKTAVRRAELARREYDSLAPLLARGFITRAELDRTALAADEADAAVRLAQKRLAALTDGSYPRRVERARLLVAQREAEKNGSQQRLMDAEKQLEQLDESIRRCSIYATHGGLVLHADNLAVTPKRKVQVGDRITASQALVTIPDVQTLRVETSIRERDVPFVHSGQPATLWADAIPGKQFEAQVLNVGSVARAGTQNPYEDKRFEVWLQVLDSTGLQPEMTARVEIMTATRKSVRVVPVSALARADAGTIVYRARESDIEPVIVRVGITNETSAEIIDGLAVGDRILADASGASPRRP